MDITEMVVIRGQEAGPEGSEAKKLSRRMVLQYKQSILLPASTQLMLQVH